MRRLTVLLILLALAPLGLTLGLAAPSAPPKKAPRAVAATPVPGAAFPNCPAPAVNGLTVRARPAAGGTALSIFVVVQNVGTRAFFAAPEEAAVTVTMGGRVLGRFPVERLSAGEVAFLRADAQIAAGDGLADIRADLAFAQPQRVGAVAGALDCQAGDNSVVRRAEALSRSIARTEG